MEEILSGISAAKALLSRGIQRIHLVGIGGIGMSGLALLLHEAGYTVSGSDIKESYITATLRRAGIKVAIGHSPGHLEGAELVCFSSAIKEANFEIQEAKRKGIPIFQRAQLLATIAHHKKSICITGSHGKTTTTSLLGFALSSLGYAPCVFVGGVPLNYSRHAWWGENYFVIEADESDGSFLYYEPHISIITNIDDEHRDYYQTFERLQDDFLRFAKNTRGVVIGCGDDEEVAAILEKVPSLRYGFSSSSTVRAQNISFEAPFTHFEVVVGRRKEKVSIPLVGKHNILNTLAIFSVFSYLGEDLGKVAKTLVNFKGTKRRFQIKATVGGVTFIDDYAHHPTEIKAVLAAAGALRPQRIVVIFEPHRFSRLALLHEQFSRCFDKADLLVLTDIYSASEEPIEGINERWMYERIKEHFNKTLLTFPKDKLIKEVPGYLEAGDVVVGVGAGEMSVLLEGVIDEYREITSQAGR